MAQSEKEIQESFFDAARKGDLDRVSSYMKKDPKKWKNAVTKGGDTALHLAAENGKVAVADYLLSQNAEIELQEEFGRTPFLLAASGGHDEVMKLLMKKGCNVKAKAMLGDGAALALAAMYGHVETVKYLHSTGFDLNETQKGDYTALHWTAHEGQLAVAEYLLSQNAEIELRDELGNTPFLCAAWSGHDEVMKLLMKKGCNIQAKSGKGDGALALAAVDGHVKSVKYLHSTGFDLNETHQGDCTALHWAAYKGQVAVAEYLLSQNAEMELYNEGGYTPFLLAASCGQDEVMKLLMKKGCNVEAKRRYRNGALALAALNGHIEIVKYLHSAGFDLNETHQGGKTALHLAAVGGRVVVSDYLLSQNAEIELQDRDGYTPFLLAASSSDDEVMKLLKKKGCNIYAKGEYGEGALAIAAIYGNVEAVKYLQSLGFDLNETIRDNATALHMAAEAGIVDVADYLLSQGVNIDVPDEKGETPFLRAASGNQVGVMELLIKNGCNTHAKDEFGRGALKIACSEGRIEAVQYLQSKGFDWDELQKAEQDNVDEESDIRSKEEKVIYERALKSGSIQVERIRLIFVGQDGSGKTALIRSLLSKPFDENLPSTDGVAIDVAVTDAEKWQEQKGRFLDRCLERGFHLVRTREGNKPSTPAVSARTGEEKTPSPPIGQKRDLPFPGQSQEERKRDEEVDVSSNLPDTREEPSLELMAFLKDSEKVMASLDQYVKMEKKLAGMKNIQLTHLWELGGQEAYLSTHYSILPSSATRNFLTAFVAVVNLSLPLGDRARSSFRSTDGIITDCTKDLGWIEKNEDFLRAWLSNFSIAYSDSLELQSIQPHLGATEDVANPPVFIAGTHLDRPLGKEFLKKQIQSVADIVEKKHYEGHIIRPKSEDACSHLFLIDNTKSVECCGVRQLRQCVDQMRKAYYSNKSPQPFRWILLEFLISCFKKNNPIIKERILTHLAIQHCGLIDDKEVALALRHLESLGVILKFPKVPRLEEEVFIDPNWVVKTLAIFVTVKQPGPLLMNAWHSLRKTGVMSKELVNARLAAAEVPEEMKNVTLDLLHHLNLTSPVTREGNAAAVGETEESGYLFIPCLLTAKSAEMTLFQQIDPSGPFPLPIMIIPSNVDAIPEALFFRLVTRFLRHYVVTASGLSRHRCLFHTAAFKVELLFADRGKAVTMTVGGNPRFLKGTWVTEIKKLREFFEKQIGDVKHPGMSGFKYEMRYYLGPGREDGGSDVIRREFVYKLFEDPRECPSKCPWVINDEDGNQPPNPEWANKVRLWFGMESGEAATGDFVTQEQIWDVSTSEKPSQRDFDQGRRQNPDLTTASKANPSKAELTEVQLTIERCVNVSELNFLSAKMISTWKSIARHLSINEDDIGQIKANNSDDIREQAFQMLSFWKKMRGRSASVGCLCKALLNENLREAAEIVFELSDDVLDYLSKKRH